MKKVLISGNESAAWAARMCLVDYIPNFPITPQTECIETIAAWVADGKMDVIFDKMDSEHSVMSAAIGASSAGGRVFTASSSQGLELMHEMLYIASGLRLPVVMATMSRGLSAPITLWTDHVDFLSQRDTGWIMFHAKNNQEVFDTILQAYRLAEDKKILLPVMVNMEGYVLSYTKEPVFLPAQSKVDRFVGKYQPKHAFFDAKHPLIQGSAAMSEGYTFFKAQQHLAQKNALSKSKEIFRKFKKEFGRSYGVIEERYTKDAEMVLVSQGSMSTTVEATVKKARENGKKIGLLRLRMIRPFPKEEVKRALEGKKAVAVLDRNIAPGSGGMMYPEIAACLYESGSHAVLSSFILGLGGIPQTTKKIAKVIEKLEKDMKRKKPRIEWNDL